MEMNEHGYNGWQGKDGTVQSARATWNVALWINNDQGTYRWRMDEKPRTADECQRFCEQVFAKDWDCEAFGVKTPDGCKLSDVNWDEISECWTEDYEEEVEEPDECWLCGSEATEDHECDDIEETFCDDCGGETDANDLHICDEEPDSFAALGAKVFNEKSVAPDENKKVI